MKRKIDLQDNSRRHRRLREVKQHEKNARETRNLHKVKVMNGYVLTSNPRKWEIYNERQKDYTLILDIEGIYL